MASDLQRQQQASVREQSVQTITNNNLTWVDVQNPTRNIMQQLAEKYHFHELSIEDSLSKIEIPKIDKYADHIFTTIHVPVMDDGDVRETTTPAITQLSIFIGSNYIVTVHQGDLRPLRNIFDSSREDKIQRDELMGTSSSSGYLLHSIIDRLVDDLFHVLRRVVGNLRDIEDDVFNEQLAIAEEISILRRQIMVLRRAVMQLRRILIDLSPVIQKYSAEDLTLYYDDVKDHMDKAFEILEESKETIEIYKDTDNMLNTEKTNRILSLLTILFTLSIPVTVIGAIYGMNVHLPGGIGEQETWNFLGIYTTFLICIMITVATVLVMIWLFRKLGWIRIGYR
jgi:magnesium transporter